MPRITHETITLNPDTDEINWRRSPSALNIHTTTIHQDHEEGSNERSHVVLQMGMGNEGRRVRLATAEQLGARGVRGITLLDATPYRKVEPDKDSLTSLAAYTIDGVALHLKEQYGIETLHAIGESQGSVAVLESMRNPNSPLNGRLGLIHPLGLTPEVLTVPRFMTRMLQTAVQNDIELAGTLVGMHASKRALGDLILTGGQQIKSAASYDGTEALKEILESHDVAVFAGEDDRLFPPIEIEDHLSRVGIHDHKYEIGDGPHAALALRVGADMGSRACFFVQSGLLLPQEMSAGLQIQHRNALEVI
jgi:hypothetical protein